MCELQRKGRRAGIFLFSLFSCLFFLSTVQAELPLAEGGGRLSDPTKPPGYQEIGAGIGVDAVPQWSLKSILISPTHRSAILNGRLIKKGEQVDPEVTVLDIRPDSVLLKGAQGEFSVNLLPASIKMPSKSESPSP